MAIISGINAKFFNVREWAFRLSLLERQTCLIETKDGEPLATGFLVGPDLVMTVSHAIILPGTNEPLSPDKLVARFDFGRTNTFVKLDKGRIVKLADKDWLLGYAPAPKTIDDKSVDTAVIRLSEAIGDDQESPRGWVQLAPRRIVLERGDGLAIIGHPEGGPLKMSMNTQSVIGYDHETGHLMYRTDTLPGSSGAPCFDLDWNFVAMHQGRSVRHGNHNRGIPFAAIFDWLQQEDIWDQVSKELGATLPK